MSPEEAASWLSRFVVAAVKAMEPPDIANTIDARIEVAKLEGEVIPALRQEVAILTGRLAILKDEKDAALARCSDIQRELADLKCSVSDSVFADPDFQISASVVDVVDYGSRLIEIQVTTTNLAIPVLKKAVPSGEAAGLASLLNSCVATAEGLNLTSDPGESQPSTESE